MFAMLIATTVGSAVLIGLLAGYLLGRDLVHRRYWFYVAGALVVLGLAVILWGAAEITDGWQRRSWPVTRGVVLESRVEGARAYHPEVVYQYTVDGNVYRDSTILHQPSFGGRSRRYEVAVKEAALYAPGDSVGVYFDPVEPQRSDLVTSLYWADYATAGVGAVLLGLGVCLWLMWIRRRPAESDSSLAGSVP